MIRELEEVIKELEADGSLTEPSRFRERVEALERLERSLLEERFSAGDRRLLEEEERMPYQRARELSDRLEAANVRLYEAIRGEIRRGNGAESLLCWAGKADETGEAIRCASGESYDYLDELLGGVLMFEGPQAEVAALATEMVAYQPTPARHIFDLLGQTPMTEGDVFVDLGSGLGHVALAASIGTNARCIGFEVEAAYVECARRSAKELKLKRVEFFRQDAREADLSRGTVFYLYTPFRGTILREVLDMLRREAAGREIRVGTFGPCVASVAEERWLAPVTTVEAGRIVVFRSAG